MKFVNCSRKCPSHRPLAACLAIALGLNVPFGSAESMGQQSAASIAPVRNHRPHFASARGRLRDAAKLQGQTPSGGPARVTNCDDSGPGSLRDIASTAEDDSSIDLTALTCSTITLTSGAVNFLIDSVALYGPGPDKLSIVGNDSDRVIGHGGSGTLSINGLTLTNGAITNSGGGCVYSAGSVRLYDTVVSSCRTYSTGPYTVLGGGVYARQALSINYSTITGNLVTGTSGAYGGGAFVRGSLDVFKSTISNNVASNSGGIAAVGDVFFGYSTISGNQANDNAGIALFGRYVTGPIVINATTISGNVASNLIGGIGVLAETHIYNSTIADNHDGGRDLGAGLFGGTSVAMYLQSTIVADNFSGGDRSDAGGYSGATLSGMNNLVMTSNLTLPPDTLMSDPRLEPLADNGGLTFTHALSPGSPAIDAGNNEANFDYDQRTDGFARVVGAASDIGAYEVQSTGATTNVANCDDSGAGSLRNAMNHAQSGDTIDLGQLACSTITLTSGALQAPQGNLTLQGPGADQLILDGNNADRVINHSSTGTLTISGVTLTHGYFNYYGFAGGGCIYDESTLALDHARVTSCRVTSSATSDFGVGGAIYARQLRMNATTVSDSQAGASEGRVIGGGIYAHAVSIRDSTVSGNTATTGSRSSASYGGGLFVSGPSTVVGSTFYGNQAGIAGGVAFDGDSEMINSTVSGNSAFFIAGGVLGAYGSLSVDNSTIAFNTASAAYVLGAGVLAEWPTRIQSTIVFGNTDGSSPYDVGAISAGVIIGAHNLIGTSAVLLPPDTIHADPLLDSLADNGGPTLTHALSSGSPAIDAGSNVANLETDQRGPGFVRVFGAGADIGAFETQVSDTIFRDGFD